MRGEPGRYVFGLARNPRLVSELEANLAGAATTHAETGQPAHRFKELFYATLDSWSRARRVIGKAEHLAKGANPRFIVTSLPTRNRWPSNVRAGLLRPRRHGKPHQGAAARHVCRSHQRCSTMRANQLRLWFASFAYVLLGASAASVSPHQVPGRHLRHHPTEAAQARRPGHGLGAADQGGDRSACPYRAEFALAHLRLAPWTGPPAARAAA